VWSEVGISADRGNNKLQAPNYNIEISNKIKRQLFGILNFGHCDLFGICVLLFEFFYC